MLFKLRINLKTPSWIHLDKIYSIIDQQIAMHFVQYDKCLSNPPSLLHATKIDNPFLNSRISANHDKGLGFKSIVKF